MATLVIRKKESGIWEHIATDVQGTQILSDFYCKTNGGNFRIVEAAGAQRPEYLYSDITVYDDTADGTAETFSSPLALMARLKQLNYPAFRQQSASGTTYIQDGTNTTVEGDGSQDNPYQINAGSVSQNNIPKVKNLTYSGQGNTTVFAGLVNAAPTFTIAEDEIFYFTATSLVEDGISPMTSIFVIKKGKGSYGSGGTSVSASDIFVIGSSAPTIGIILSNPDVQEIELGEIGDTGVSDALNETDPAIVIQSQAIAPIVVHTTVDGNEVDYLFLGSGGTYGTGATQSTPNQFQILSSVIAPINPGDYIPLSGTTEGNPVTGDIESNADIKVQRLAVYMPDDGSTTQIGWCYIDGYDGILRIFNPNGTFLLSVDNLGYFTLYDSEGNAKANFDWLGNTDGRNYGLPNADGRFPLSVSVNGGTPATADSVGNIDLTVTGGTGVQSVIGDSVDNTDPDNPVIPHIVQSVTGTAVDITDPDNPVIDTPEINLAFIQNDSDLKLYTNTSAFQIALPLVDEGGSHGPGLMSYADKVKLDGVSDPTTSTIGALINGATSKTTPVDADQIGLMDSAASNVLKKLSWANIKATLKTYFDTLYIGASGVISSTLSGFSAAAGTVSSSDSILSAIQKIVGNIAVNTSDLATAEKYFGRDMTSSSTVTGTTANTILISKLIPAGATATGSEFTVRCTINKTAGTTLSNFTIRTNTSNSLSGSTVIATYAAASPVWNQLKRTFTVKSGSNLFGFNSILNAISDEITTTSAPTTTTWNPAVDNWIIIAIQPGSTSESFTSETFTIKGIK